SVFNADHFILKYGRVVWQDYIKCNLGNSVASVWSVNPYIYFGDRAQIYKWVLDLIGIVQCICERREIVFCGTNTTTYICGSQIKFTCYRGVCYKAGFHYSIINGWLIIK